MGSDGRISSPMEAATNPNWKGGISKIKTFEDFEALPTFAKGILKRKILSKLKKCGRTGCWNWVSSLFTSNGRARLCLGYNSLLASRVSYWVYKGDTKGKLVTHTCDNPLCVNPEHLVLGTNKDNSQDMVSKGRSLVCQKNPAAVLTNLQVKIIKKRLEKGDLRSRIAREYGVSWTTIASIKSGKSWGSL